jgi:uncharacterized protein (DUF1330 family)
MAKNKKSYCFVEIDITDPVAYSDYMKRSTPAVQMFNGRFLVRGGNPVVVEGNRNPKRVVIVEFDGEDTARRFYDSPQYQEAAKYRIRASTANYYLLEGA